MQQPGRNATQAAQTTSWTGASSRIPLRKYLADQRRQAEAERDPARKAEILQHIKSLNDKVGKVGAYEGLYPTVREVREVKALLRATSADEHNGDWKTGITQMQEHIGPARQIDQQLEGRHTQFVQKIWDEAPDAVPKIIPALVEKFAAEKPQEYAKFIAQHAIGHLDTSGFPQAFDRMAALYEAGKVDEAKALKQEQIEWVVGQRNAAKVQPKQADPEVERLKAKLQDRETKDTKAANGAALTAVESHSLPILEKAIKGIVGKLGLSQDQIQA